jgi:hypothetical protein
MTARRGTWICGLLGASVFAALLLITVDTAHARGGAGKDVLSNSAGSKTGPVVRDHRGEPKRPETCPYHTYHCPPGNIRLPTTGPWPTNARDHR